MGSMVAHVQHEFCQILPGDGNIAVGDGQDVTTIRRRPGTDGETAGQVGVDPQPTRGWNWQCRGQAQTVVIARDVDLMHPGVRPLGTGERDSPV